MLFPLLALLLLSTLSGMHTLHCARGRWSTRPAAPLLMAARDQLILDGIPLLLERQSRPGHVYVPRTRMDLQFAVLLMRSSYQAADEELNYYPMDEFQREQFLFRQSEWEYYKDKHQTCLQGDLADPVYFDFISFVQYVTLGWTMRHGLQDFVEKVGAEGESVVVARPPAYTDNAMLPAAHSRIVGDKIVNTFFEKYPPSILPPAERPAEVTRAAAVAAVQQLLDVFTINAYCLSATVKDVTTADDATNGVLTLKTDLQLPANLWSELTLRARRESPVNDFDNMAIDAYMRRWGLQTALVSSGVTNQIDIHRVLRITGLNA